MPWGQFGTYLAEAIIVLTFICVGAVLVATTIRSVKNMGKDGTK